MFVLPRVRLERSDALDPPATENAVGANHQGDNHQDVRGEILGAAADIGIEIAGGQVFNHANDQTTDDSADDRVESAQNNHGKHLETDERELVIDPEHGPRDDASKRRDDPGHGPSESKVALYIDRHRHLIARTPPKRLDTPVTANCT